MNRHMFQMICVPSLMLFMVAPTTKSDAHNNNVEIKQVQQKLQSALQNHNSNWLLQHHHHPIDRQFLIPWEPDYTPEYVCSNFQNFGGNLDDGSPRYTCTCTNSTADAPGLLEIDGNVVVSCVENAPSCTDANSSFCFSQVFRQLLDDTLNVTKTESCANFTSTNFTQYTSAGFSAPLDPAGHIFCVTMEPHEPNNFTVLTSCTATMDGNSCFLCNICEETRITFDCCNVEADFRSTCGPVGGNGAYLPFFDRVTEEGVCEGSSAFSNNKNMGGTILIMMMSTALMVWMTANIIL